MLQVREREMWGGHHAGVVRNPLTAALAAMAVHAAVSLVAGWPYPSVATFAAGLLGLAGALFRPSAPPRAVAGMAALAVVAPSLLPMPLLAAGIAALGTARLPPARDPLGNLAIALPALCVLVLAASL